MATVVEVAGGGVCPQFLEWAHRGWAFADVGPGWAARRAFVKGSPRCRRRSQPSGDGAGSGKAFPGVGAGWAARPAFLKGSPRCRRPSQPSGDGAGPGGNLASCFTASSMLSRCGYAY